MAYFTLTNSQHKVPSLRVLSTMVSVGRLLGLITLLFVATLVCTGVRSEKSTAEEIKDTISEWRDMIVSSVSNKLDEITDFDTISRIIDATLEEDCELEPCKPGFNRTSNPLYTPVSNGCGSMGYQWKRDMLPEERLEDCCNDHDFCYDECGADKDLCDFKFKKCLYKVCKSHLNDWTSNQMKACKAAAKIMFTGTQALGCKAYLDAQELACHCIAMPSSENSYKLEL